MRTLNETIDLTPYAAAVNGALAHRRPAFVATSSEPLTGRDPRLSATRPTERAQ